MHRMKLLAMASLLGAAGLMGGCASVSVHPVSVADASNPSVNGIRFYQSTPYLLVTEMPTPPHVMFPRGRPGMRPQGPRMAMSGRGMPMMHGHRPEAMHGGPQRWRHEPHGRMGMRHPMMPMMPMTAAQRMMMLQIIYLPDFSKPYVADFNDAFSHKKNSILLANGWELMGLNVKGHITEPPPIRAIDAVPIAGPLGRPMLRQCPMGPMRGNGHRLGPMHPMGGMGRGMMHGKHGLPHGGHKMCVNPGMMGGMMHRPAMRINRLHRMMMARRAAMMMGLAPGLYQFIYSPKTGQLIGLRRVRILPSARSHPQIRIDGGLRG